MSGQAKKNNHDEVPSSVEVELLAVDEEDNYQGLTLKCILVYLVRPSVVIHLLVKLTAQSILSGCFAQVLAIVATGAVSLLLKQPVLSSTDGNPVCQKHGQCSGRT